MRAWLHYLRSRDSHSANGVDRLIASSQFVARQMMKTYRREAAVIVPPVDVHKFELNRARKILSDRVAMLPYERIDLIVEAFTATAERRLIVIGAFGPALARIAANSGPSPITISLRCGVAVKVSTIRSMRLYGTIREAVR